MFRFRSTILTLPLCGVSLATTANLLARAVLCEEEPRKQEREPEMINLYLKPDSQTLLSKYLKSRGYSNHKTDFICLHSNPDASVSYIFQPLFGQRAAFRLKGIVELPDGNAVAVGKMSNMVGEVKDDHFYVSMPIIKSDSKDKVDVRLLTDLPTRISKIFDLSTKTIWKGRVPPGKIGDRSYEAIQVSFNTIPLNKQLVVDGHLCSTKYADAEGKCNFEELQLVSSPSNSNGEDQRNQEKPIDTEENVISHETNEKKQQHSSTPPEAIESKAECPICRYMKNGPCKDDFVAWEDCLSSLKEGQELIECAKQTGVMMKCMQQYEYYDIMTAGTDYGRVDSLLVEPTLPESQKQLSNTQEDK